MHSPVRIGEGREAGILDLGDGRVLRLRAIARLAEGIDAERALLLKLLQAS